MITDGKPLVSNKHHHIPDEAHRQRILSYVRCPSCDAVPTRSFNLQDMYDYGEIICAGCAEPYDIETANVLPSHSAYDFLGPNTLDNIRSSTWYHASTTQPREFMIGAEADIPLSPCTHVGTLVSASYRAQQEGFHSYYLYRFQISPDATLDPEVHLDLSQWSYAVSMLRDDTFGMVRYINRWEGVGEVSLLVHPKHLRLLSVERRHNSRAKSLRSAS